MLCRKVKKLYIWSTRLLACHLLSAVLVFCILVLGFALFSCLWFCLEPAMLCNEFVNNFDLSVPCLRTLYALQQHWSLYIHSFHFAAKCTCCQELSQLTCCAVVFPATCSDCLNSSVEKAIFNVIVAWHFWTMIWGTIHIYWSL